VFSLGLGKKDEKNRSNKNNKNEHQVDIKLVEN
jgi:hypothetical protein